MTAFTATDADLARFLHTVRTRREGNHPTGGNLYADCLDALINHAHDEDATSAEALLDIAEALTIRADQADDSDGHGYAFQRDEYRAGVGGL